MFYMTLCLLIIFYLKSFHTCYLDICKLIFGRISGQGKRTSISQQLDVFEDFSMKFKSYVSEHKQYISKDETK